MFESEGLKREKESEPAGASQRVFARLSLVIITQAWGQQTPWEEKKTLCTEYF